MTNERVYPYSERDSVSAGDDVGRLVAGPELYVTDAEIIQLRTLARRLYEGPSEADGGVGNLLTISEIPLGAASKTFYLDYFHTKTGPADLAKLGVAEGIDPVAAMSVLCGSVADGTVPPVKDRREVATASRDWYLGELTENLLTEADGETWQDSPTFSVNFEPENLLKKFEALQLFRSYYRTISQELRTNEDPLAEKQQKLLAIHRAKVNAMTADLYPDVLNLAKQLSMSPENDKTWGWQHRLLAAAPVVRHLYAGEATQNTELQGDMLRRLDMVRNGAEVAETTVDTHRFSAISQADLSLAAEIDRTTQEAILDDVEKLPAEVVAELKAQTWTFDDALELLGEIAGDYLTLSAEAATEDEVKARAGAASDNGWQLVRSSSAKSLSVNGVKRVMMIPESFSQDGVAALAVISHEMTHMVQNDADLKTAEDVSLARVKGRRVQAGRELGGINEERRVRAMCGEGRPVSTAYLRALQVKEADGNQLEGARAYLDSTLNGEPVTPDAKKKAQTASDRVLRLYRQGGYDSQALDYLEQELLFRELSSRLPQDQVRAILTSAMSFSLKDAATLHELGLLQLPDPGQGPTIAEDVVRKYLSRRATQPV